VCRAESRSRGASFPAPAKPRRRWARARDPPGVIPRVLPWAARAPEQSSGEFVGELARGAVLVDQPPKRGAAVESGEAPGVEAVADLAEVGATPGRGGPDRSAAPRRRERGARKATPARVGDSTVLRSLPGRRGRSARRFTRATRATPVPPARPVRRPYVGRPQHSKGTGFDGPSTLRLTSRGLAKFPTNRLN